MPEEQERELKPLPEAESAYLRWLAHLDAEFTRHHKPEIRSEIVRDELHQLYLGRPHGGKLNFTLMTELPVQRAAADAGPAQCDAAAGILSRRGPGEVCRGEAADLVLADVRSLPGRTQRLAGLALSLHAGTSYFQTHRQAGANLSRRGIHLWLQPDDRGQLHHP